MSRQSAEAASVVALVPGTRAPVPAELSEAEAAIWRDVVDSKPAEWFGPDSLPVLKEYCRAADMCDRLVPLVEKAMASGKGKDIVEILAVRNKEATRVAALATKLRLTQQSRYTPQASATANRKVAGGKRPWD
jgi:hypothetical protein